MTGWFVAQASLLLVFFFFFYLSPLLQHSWKFVCCVIHSCNYFHPQDRRDCTVHRFLTLELGAGTFLHSIISSMMWQLLSIPGSHTCLQSPQQTCVRSADGRHKTPPSHLFLSLNYSCNISLWESYCDFSFGSQHNRFRPDFISAAPQRKSGEDGKQTGCSRVFLVHLFCQ